MRPQYVTDFGCIRRKRYLATIPAFSLLLAFATQVQAQTIPLGNLFDDPKLTELGTAIASDGYGAIAAAADLGVVSVGSSLGEPTQITPSQIFNFNSAGGGNANPESNPLVMNDASIANPPGFPSGEWPIRTTGLPLTRLPGPKIEDGVGMHANNYVTFDLNEIRAAGNLPSDTPFNFSAVGALNDSALGAGGRIRLAAIISDGNIFTGYLNGVLTPIIPNQGVLEFDLNAISGTLENGGITSATFDLTISGNAQYLTLASLSVGSINNDHAVFSAAEITPEPSILGDANDDGVLNNLDIASFVLALISPSAYQAMFPDVDPEVVLDMNGDGGLNNLDIAGFVTALIG